ncbi:acyl-CoA/acyl-ACP dehydrogenase [Qipengyuania aquimaris]|uniref:acyl-CoA dehydrogenase family protein n=1 Tax=Qipengyuania aquimaris TaxID=255984 RepID=UPI001C94BFCF|nr:acyl-CoA dehydrogenase family protein [Qipengyuania aquimaris]MBY6128379.1 acyl-CoA/acyl-ACP dehydrogenase [Qipengyuania aquimaris]
MTRELLGRIGGELERAVATLAARCARDGRIDPALADEHQLASYEVAVVHADLLAAQSCLNGHERMNELDRDLATAFIAESFVTSLGRLEEIHAGLGLDTGELLAIRASDDFAELRSRGASPAFLSDLGERVVEHDGELGAVELDEMAAMAAEGFSRFARDVVAPLAEDIHRKDLTVPESLLQPMREMGVFGLSIPEAYGGSAGERENTPLMIAVTEALSEASLAAAGSLITRPEILARALLAGGTEEQKREWLPRIAAGDPLCAISITEPDYGSDVASLALRGTKTEGGWLLNGAKTWCTFAGKAGLLMVVTRTDPDRSKGHRGLSVLLVEKPSVEGHEFLVEQDGGGTLKGKAIPTIGYRGMHSFDLAFEDFFVPDANVIGGEDGLGRGFYLTMAGMTGGRIQTAGRALGLMRASLKAAIAYARERKVFGQPLAQYQLTQVKIAKMAARYVACRQLAFDVGRRLDEGGGSGEASVAKLISCRSAETVSREALQIHGGMGYAEEMPVSRYWIDARVLSIFEGAEETLALKVIARGLIDAALKQGA